MCLIIVRVVSLQTVNGGSSHHGSKVWIFSIGLLTTSPTRIPENIDIRSPERKSIVFLVFVLADGIIILGSCLVRYIGKCLKMHIRIKCGGHSDSLRIHCGKSCTGNPVKRFIPPVIIRYSKTRNSL